MTDPGSELRDLFYSRAERVDLAPVLPAEVRRKVRRLRRRDALLVGIALVVAVAGTSVVVARFERSSLPPAEDVNRVETTLFEAPLDVGSRYRSKALGGVRFSITEALAGNHVHIQSQRLLGLHTEGANGLAVRRVTRVHHPETGERIPAPEDLVRWLLSHPKIRAERAGTLNVDGALAVVLVMTDAEVDPAGPPCSEGLLEPLPCLPLIASRELGFYARADDLIRVYVFRHGGQRYTAEAFGTERRPELAERWDAFMRSLDFEV